MFISKPCRWINMLLVAVMLLAACTPPAPTREVVIYTSVDQVFAEPVLKRFESESGVRVKAVYDVEATKTTGLVNRLIAEKDRPLADVFWSGEFVQTLLLQEKGVLQPYASPNAQTIPAIYKDPNGYWTGFAGRMRVLLANTKLLVPEKYPRSVADLLTPSYPAQQVGMANPLFGTTLTHAAALYALWGPQKGREFFQVIKERGIQVVDGNSVVRDMVVDGRLAWGLLDSDDACGALDNKAPVAMTIPDQGGMGSILGTLVIPNTVAVVAGAPHLTEARLLVDYLLRAQTEQDLVQSGWSHMPLHPGVQPTGCFAGSKIMDLRISLSNIYSQLQVVQKDLAEIFMQ
jgi:iron(III) transport system substrate-binding protein